MSREVGTGITGESITHRSFLDIDSQKLIVCFHGTYYSIDDCSIQLKNVWLKFDLSLKIATNQKGWFTTLTTYRFSDTQKHCKCWAKCEKIT